ncbi:site-specific integrase [Noviherbaspirillum aridicola]|uniref:site-specific integrase n=1 Tax=Noviherbaspirillum aridicola TaxID=2849687 RepID=UPI001C818B29|nr:site-specific integrase [Noviherbaspirillum aridicola]
MSVYVKRTANGRYQLRVRHALLQPNGEFYLTFTEEADARRYGDQLDHLLARGVVPKDLLERPDTTRDGWSLSRCIAEYLRVEDVKPSEAALLATVRPEVGHVMTWALSYDWAEGWVRTMKREKNLAPSTIRHRHGALARCLDWVMRKHLHVLASNPLRLLKRGFATYSAEDGRVAIAHGGTRKQDRERNRRLAGDEAQRLTEAVRADPELELLFHLALETAMRLRECYTLTVDQVRLDQRTILLETTKNGSSRQVPMSRPIHTRLTAYLTAHRTAIADRGGRLFSCWAGQTDEKVLDRITSRVSHRFALVVRTAGLHDFHFHDLRHEATCRLYLRTHYSDVQIARITGHRDLRMLKRYASLRGCELAEGMWGWDGCSAAGGEPAARTRRVKKSAPR